MLKRVAIIAGVGLAAVFALPTVALAQEEQGSTETTSTTSEPATEPVVSEETSSQQTEVTRQTEVTVEEESTEESDTTSDEIEPQTAPAGDSSTGTTASIAANTTTATQSSLGSAWKPGSKKKASASSRKKRCSASSRGGGQLAQASAPVASGCVRLDGGDGPLVLPDGTTLNITETSDGQISFTVSGGPTGLFSGTIFVKGGPSSPGFACVFNGVTAGTCHTPVNSNNGKFFGVSHVDACPGAFVPPGAQPDEEGRRERDKRERDKVEGGRRKREVTTVAATTTVVAPAEQLPFTGLPVTWLLILGGALLSSGVAIRRAS
jgi:hypothetical protein